MRILPRNIMTKLRPSLEKAVAKKEDADKNASIASDNVTNAEKTKKEAIRQLQIKEMP